MSENHKGNKLILIVEDQPMVANALRVLLKIDGYEVVIAQNGREGLEAYEPGKFLLIFTDFNMPEMSGREFAAAVKARDSHQPIILVTAYSDLALHDSRPAVVDLVLEKPWSVEALRGAMTQVLGDSARAK